MVDITRSYYQHFVPDTRSSSRWYSSVTARIQLMYFLFVIFISARCVFAEWMSVTLFARNRQCCSSFITVHSNIFPLRFARQHPSYGDCLEVKKEYHQTCSVLDCVTQYDSQQYTYMSSSYKSNRLGLSHWDPYTVHRSNCLELYYCNMVEWFWWNSSMISTTNWFPSGLWQLTQLV